MNLRKQIDILKAIELYESGMNQAEVAKKLGTTQRVVWSRFKDYGYTSRVAKKRDQSGDKNHMWKGVNAGYSSLHRRVERYRGKPRVCSMCETKEAIEYNWASMTQDYANIFDYIRLCRGCHAKMDNHARHLPGKVSKV